VEHSCVYGAVGAGGLEKGKAEKALSGSEGMSGAGEGKGKGGGRETGASAYLSAEVGKREMLLEKTNWNEPGGRRNLRGVGHPGRS